MESEKEGKGQVILTCDKRKKIRESVKRVGELTEEKQGRLRTKVNEPQTQQVIEQSATLGEDGSFLPLVWNGVVGN